MTEGKELQSGDTVRSKIVKILPKTVNCKDHKIRQKRLNYILI